MERAELERCKRVLEGYLRPVVKPVGGRDEIAVENAPDTIDRVQRAAERELAIRQFEADYSRIHDVKLALQRIADGTYGTCLECEQEIGQKRLSAVPWASHCVQCQELADARKKESAEEEEWAPVMRGAA